MTRKLALLAEAALVAGTGAAMGLALFSQWFLSCCRPLVTGWLGSLFTPGALIAMFIGGGAGRATVFDAAVGVAIELLVIWGIIRWGLSRRRRRDATCVGAERNR
jgi:hypothetical protein